MRYDLQGFTVRDEYQVKGVFTYAPDQNPNHEYMLYELVVYTLITDSPRHRSVILYPTIDATGVD